MKYTDMCRTRDCSYRAEEENLDDEEDEENQGILNINRRNPLS